MSNSNILIQGIPVERPPHEPGAFQIANSEIVATWPVGTFVENLVVDEDGTVYASVESLREIQAVDRNGHVKTLAKFESSVTGLTLTGNEILANTGTIGQPVWSVARLSKDGDRLGSISIDDALFLNGSTRFRDQKVLVPDSILGRIYEVDVAAGSASVWLDHDLFKKVTSEPMLPGINGLRVSGDHAYFTNTDRAILGYVEIERDGRAGTVKVLAERFVGDDFAVASDGSLFVTNHVYNTLTRLTPQGERIVVAGPDEGMAGSTSAAFHRQSLYVTTTGGILAPYEGIVREAKLIRVEVGIDAGQVGFGGDER